MYTYEYFQEYKNFLLRITHSNGKEFKLNQKVTAFDEKKQIVELENGNYKLRLKSDKLYARNILTGKYELVDQDKWYGSFEK